nr:MAG TPA: hypothetical protein [Caudoviricetes sp.]
MFRFFLFDKRDGRFYSNLNHLGYMRNVINF